MNLSEIFDLLSSIRLSELSSFSSQLNIHELAQDPIIIGAGAGMAIVSLFMGWKLLLTLLFGIIMNVKLYTMYTYPGDTIYDMPMEKLVLVGAVTFFTFVLSLYFLFTSSER